MWQIHKPYYSEKVMKKLLKEAPLEKQIEFLLGVTRRKKDGK